MQRVDIKLFKSESDWSSLVRKAICSQNRADGLCGNCMREWFDIWYQSQYGGFVLFRFLQYCSFSAVLQKTVKHKCWSFSLALQFRMLSMHTWSTLGWGLGNPAIWSPNGAERAFFLKLRWFKGFSHHNYLFVCVVICVTMFCSLFYELQKSMKAEKDGDDKVKKSRFPILGPQRRPSRIEAGS